MYHCELDKSTREFVTESRTAVPRITSHYRDYKWYRVGAATRAEPFLIPNSKTKAINQRAIS